MDQSDIAAITSLRADGLTHKAIAAIVGCTHKAVAYHLKKAAYESRMYPLEKIRLPLVTDSGLMWHEQVEAPVHNSQQDDCCAHCELEAECGPHVAIGDYMACERPMLWEVRE